MRGVHISHPHPPIPVKSSKFAPWRWLWLLNVDPHVPMPRQRHHTNLMPQCCKRCNSKDIKEVVLDDFGGKFDGIVGGLWVHRILVQEELWYLMMGIGMLREHLLGWSAIRTKGVGWHPPSHLVFISGTYPSYHLNHIHASVGIITCSHHLGDIIDFFKHRKQERKTEVFLNNITPGISRKYCFFLFSFPSF